MKRGIFFCILVCTLTSMQAKRDSCTLKSILLALRSLQNDSSEILGKVCTIEDVTIEILEKVCDLDFSPTVVLEKICDIEVTTTLILDKVCDILETVTTGFACNAAPISMPVTITEPGSYCLTQSINGDIVIATNGVILNLNGCTVFGAIDIIAQEDVVIENGFISAPLAGCVMISGSTKVEVRNIFFSDSATGVSVTSSEGIVIKECIFDAQATSAVTTLSSSNLTLQDLKASQCGTAYSITGGNVVSCINCQALESTADGFLLSSIDDLQLTNCISSGSATNGFSFMNTCTNAQLNNCTGSGSGTGSGFLLDSANNFQLTSCLASGNGSDGFRGTGAYRNVQILECEARGNTGTGLAMLSGGLNIQLVECLSDGNGANGISVECEGVQILDSLSSNNTSAAPNGNGFLIQGGDALCTNCSGKNNRNGFAVLGTTGDGTVATFRECEGVQNSEDGFNYSTVSNGIGNIQILSCSVIDNNGTGIDIIGSAGLTVGAIVSFEIDFCSILRNTVLGIGLAPATATTFRITDCSISENADTGVFLRNLGPVLNRGEIASCSVMSNGGHGIRVINSINGTMDIDTRFCSIEGNALTGFFVTAATNGLMNLKLDSCSSNQHGTAGMSFNNAPNARLNCEISNCAAIGNTGRGIEVVNPSAGSITGCSIDNCSTIGNGAEGIRLDSTGGTSLEFSVNSCSSLRNSNGIVQVGGGGGATGVIMSSEAINNTPGDGIRRGAASVHGFNNISLGNGGMNYVGITPVISAGLVTSSTGFWFNVGT